MRKLEQFQCDICGTVYKTEGDCNRCEKGHNIPIKIIGYKFNAIRNNGEYPKEISIEMSDGTIRSVKL